MIYKFFAVVIFLIGILTGIWSISYFLKSILFVAKHTTSISSYQLGGITVEFIVSIILGLITWFLFRSGKKMWKYS